MKKTLCVLVLLVVAIISGCGDSSSASQETVTLTTAPRKNGNFVSSGFSVDQTISAGEVILAFTPESAGLQDDGFIVSFQNRECFIFENNPLVLSQDFNYQIVVSRAFATERGFVRGEPKVLEINPGKPVAPYLQSVELHPWKPLLGWLLPPRIIANFTNGDFVVNPYFYQGPPIVCDELEVVYNGFVRAGITPIYAYGLPAQAGTEFKLPADPAFIGVNAASLYNDKENNRILVSASSFMEFLP